MSAMKYVSSEAIWKTSDMGGEREDAEDGDVSYLVTGISRTKV